MINQVTDMQSIASTLRRRSRLLAAAALVGFILGIGYVLALPPPMTSTTLVLLPTPAVSEVSNSDIDTQVRIALSATILERAGQAVAPPLSARSVKKMVNVSAPTNQVIQIETERADVLRQLMSGFFEGHKNTRLSELRRPANQKFHCQKRFAAPGTTTNQRRATSWQPPSGDFVESLNADRCFG